jgi:hypothetical protein
MEKLMAIGMTAADNAEINIGDTSIRTLRKAYGAKFAEGCGDDEKLRNALCQMDEASRSTLVHDQLEGKLEWLAGSPLDDIAQIPAEAGDARRHRGRDARGAPMAPEGPTDDKTDRSRLKPRQH